MQAQQNTLLFIGVRSLPLSSLLSFFYLFIVFFLADRHNFNIPKKILPVSNAFLSSHEFSQRHLQKLNATRVPVERRNCCWGGTFRLFFWRAEEESIGDVLSTWGLFPPWDGDKNKKSRRRRVIFKKWLEKREKEPRCQFVVVLVIQLPPLPTLLANSQPTNFVCPRKRRGKWYGGYIVCGGVVTRE